MAGVAALASYEGSIGCPVSPPNISSGPLPGGPGLPSAPVASGCELLYSSREAVLLGVHLNVLAPVYFGALLGASLLAAVRRGLLPAAVLVLLYGGGALMVPRLVGAELREGVICPYCTVMHASIIAGLVGSVLLLRSRLERSRLGAWRAS